MRMSQAKPLSWIAALSITVALCCVSLLLAWTIAGRAESRSLSAPITLPCLPTQNVQVLGNGVIYADGAYLRALNAGGGQIWSYAAGSGAEYHAEDAGVATWSGTTLTLLNAGSGAPLFSGSMGQAVLDAKVGALYAAVQVGTESEGEMVILEHNGAEVDRISIESQTVLDFGFFNEGAMLWIMSVDTEGTVPLCTITTYKPGRTQTGAIRDVDQVLYRVLFQSSRVLSIGTVYVKSYDYTGVEDKASRKLVYGWYLMSCGGTGERFTMAYVPMPQASALSQIRDVRIVSSSVDKSVRLPFAGFSVAVYDQKVYGFATQYIMRYAAQDAKAKTYALPMQVDELIGVTGDGAAVLASGEAVYLVPLP